MKKAILMSIKPGHCCNILNLIKDLELRKTAPKEWLDYFDFFKNGKKPEPVDVYIYCCKSNTQYLTGNSKVGYSILTKKASDRFSNEDYFGNGKVIAKFTLKEIDKHHILPDERILPFNWNVEQKLDKLCLTKQEVMNYGKGQDYYAYLWHIDNLVIFDRPMLLKNFKRVKWEKCGVKDKDGLYQCHKCPYAIHYGHGFGDCGYDLPLKAPQSWSYVEVDL